VYANGTLMNTSDYVVQWRISSLNKGCCSVSGGAYAHSSSPASSYSYYVYFHSIPASGTTLSIEVSYQ
jgi:hypothetical protein